MRVMVAALSCVSEPKELLLYAYEKSLFQLRARAELLGVEIVVCHEQGQWN